MSHAEIHLWRFCSRIIESSINLPGCSVPRADSHGCCSILLRTSWWFLTVSTASATGDAGTASPATGDTVAATGDTVATTGDPCTATGDTVTATEYPDTVVAGFAVTNHRTNLVLLLKIMFLLKMIMLILLLILLLQLVLLMMLQLSLLLLLLLPIVSSPSLTFTSLKR